MTKSIQNRKAETTEGGYGWTKRNPLKAGQTVVIAK
jgi:hypothetical protein